MAHPPTHSVLVLAITLLLGTLLSGCFGGDYRRMSLREDMTPGDLAHYRTEAQGTEGNIESYRGALPASIVPVLTRTRHATADAVSPGKHHFHFEDAIFTTFGTITHREVANFDDAGVNLSYEAQNIFLFWAFSSTHGYRRVAGGERVPTSGFSILWDLFATRKDIHGRSWKFLWIPIGGSGEA